MFEFGKIHLTVFVATFILSYHYFTPQPIDYGLMFDAGSTGSRIHVYSFDARSNKLLKEILVEVKPGLSGYSDPEEAARSLGPLLDIALRNIPPAQHSATPLALKATAGLRLIGVEEAEATLEAVRRFLSLYPFRMEPNAVEIMPGSEEGVYAWMTVNYLLGRFENPSSSSVSIMDLGGGSTQIVFEPNPIALTGAPGPQSVLLKMGERVYQLYQNSYDGYGLNSARSRILSLALPSGADPAVPVPHPCIPVGHTETLAVNGNSYTFVASEVPNFQECAALAGAILNKGQACPIRPCSFNGIFQPEIGDPEIFNDDMYAYSYFYDRTQIDGKRYPDLTVGDFGERAEKACALQTPDREHGVLCLDLSYQYMLLHEGYHLKNDQHLKIYKKINGVETAWTLGAMVALMQNVTIVAVQ